MVAKTHPIIQLRYSDKGQSIVIAKDDDSTDEEGRLVMTVAAAIDACDASGKKQEFYRQFRDLRGRLQAWVEKFAKDIDEAYLTVRDSSILFLVVQTSPAFNQELEDSLTDLDISIAHDGDLDLVRLNVLAIPKSSTESVRSLLV